MSRWQIASLICVVLFSTSMMEAQTPSYDEPPPPKRSALFKSKEPIPAAHKPFFVPTGLDLKVNLGFVFTSSGIPSGNRLNLMGGQAALIADVSPYFGLTADSCYARADNVFGTNHAADVLSYLAGPILYPLKHGRLRMYVHGLAGGARVTGAIPSTDSPLVIGFVNKFSWAVGGGVEYQLSRSISLRSGGDYQHTYFFNPRDVIQGQHDFRAVCSIVFSVWRHPKRRD